MKQKFNLQILHTSDTHGYIFPYYYPTMEDRPLGLAKLHTLIKKVKKEDSLLIDTGDTIQGSPLTYFHQKKMQNETNPLTKVQNFINYDYVSIGNHEFNYGLNYLNHYLNKLTPTVLNSNLLNADNNLPFKGKAYDIFDLHGIKVGIIGVTTHYIPNWEQPSHYEGITILDAYETTKKYVEELKDQTDFIIVNYHGGFERSFDTFEFEVDDTGENQGSRIMKEIDGVDILLTGHQHRSLLGSKYNTFFSQPGFNGQQLNEINIEFEVENDTLSFKVSGEIHKVTEEEPDMEIIDLIMDEETQTQQFLDTPVGRLDEELLITDQLASRLDKHPLVSLINQVQLEFTNADISSCSLGNFVSGFRKDITIRDILGTYIFPNTLVVKELSGKDVRHAIEKSAEFFEVIDGEIQISPKFNVPKLQLYAYDMYDGITYTMNISKAVGNRVESLTFKGDDVTDDMTFSVVMNNYRASGGGDFTFIKNCKTLHDTQTEVIELLIDYIVRTKHIKINHIRNITILK